MSRTAAHAAMAALLEDLPRTRDETADGRAIARQRPAKTLWITAPPRWTSAFLQLAEHGREADADQQPPPPRRWRQQLERVDGALNDTGQKLARVVDMMAQGVDDVLHRTAHSVDEARKGVAAQHDAMLAMTADASGSPGSQYRREPDGVERTGSPRSKRPSERIAERLVDQREQRAGRNDPADRPGSWPG